MKNASRSLRSVFSVCATIAVLCGVAALGYTLNLSLEIIPATTALAMIVDTMIPEALEKAQNFTKLISCPVKDLSFIPYSSREKEAFGIFDQNAVIIK